MPLAQVIRIDERQPAGRPRRAPEPAMGVILRFPDRFAAPAMPGFAGDEDRTAGRGRDPG